MARRNRFVPSYTGYRAVMNSRNEVMTACEIKAGAIAASASRQSGTVYNIDSMTGLNRVHTRVSTDGTEDYFREAHYHALAIALESMGGTVSRTNRRGYRRKG